MSLAGSLANEFLGQREREERERSFLPQLQEGMSSFSDTGREGKRIRTVKGWRLVL